MSICLEKIQAKFDRPGLKHLGPAWRGYNYQMASTAHRSDDITCAGMPRTQGASMGGFGAPMWVYNTQEVWCSNSKICGSDTPNSVTIYLIWGVRGAYARAGHAQACMHGHTGLSTCWGTLADGLGKLTASNFEKFKSFENFKICMGKTVRFPFVRANARASTRTASRARRWGGNMSSMCPPHAVKI